MLFYTAYIPISLSCHGMQRGLSTQDYIGINNYDTKHRILEEMKGNA